mmetsp:Transcript_11378/g.23011  ORF Transcript_11378/g.23011 Transcript_11378/m.23011 type:complete len:688 (-) Transcript_11378:280-2343(-)|eukprot:CAMPEP_0184686516 /NCGR_PEP_ID=MMETSP0312-20130426/22758_1 /TAXON_ID=31354 /ORGANISM="Compsopogon coeruleus, Strain SAG 36.94" /LENGTH=687 /DNA_ID=CAMNT_0027141677 /DNA_START=32 /DNA_END=2095 /DNA_ORIENTATION=+
MVIKLEYPSVRVGGDPLGSLVPVAWELLGCPPGFEVVEGSTYRIDDADSNQMECLRLMEDPSTKSVSEVEGVIQSAVDSQSVDGLASWLNTKLVFRSYVVGYRPTVSDLVAYYAILSRSSWKVDPRRFRFAYRWYRHMDADWESIASRKVEVDVIDLEGSWAEVAKLVGSQGSWKINLPGLVDDRSVVTRFPPEPSGYLHIGHAKAALLNDFIARTHKGTLVIRFDDTNPVKEKAEFEENILKDLQLLGIAPDRIEYSSDYFDRLLEFADKMVREGSAYPDKSSQDEIREQRMSRVRSPYRDTAVEENVRLWEEMKKGSEEGKQCVLRAKFNFESDSGAMRDPTMYRFIFDIPHHRTGFRYFLYPLYDFACPVIDSLEGVTHALRSAEYSDREEQYKEFCRKAGVRVPEVWVFSRLNFTYTVMSKRKLAWFVDKGYVDGWSDPRFPTIQGIRRRGMQIPALRAFILSQGASKNAALMEWDKIWTINKTVIDPIAPRHTAIDRINSTSLVVRGIKTHEKMCPKHKKNATVGMKSVTIASNVILEYDDASSIEVGETVTLMDWGNVRITQRTEDGSMEAEYLPEDTDFRRTKKLTWLARIPELVPLVLIKYRHLITKKKLEEEDTLDDIINPRSKMEEECLGDPNLVHLQAGDIIQLERRGYYICDAVDGPVRILIEIPDGRGKPEDQV